MLLNALTHRRWFLPVIFMLALCVPAGAQEVEGPPASPAITSQPIPAGAPAGLPHDRPAWDWLRLVPRLDSAAVTWVGVLLTLVLLMSSRRLLRLSNLDALAVVGLYLLLGLAHNGGTALAADRLVPWAGHSWMWWLGAGIAALAGYLLLRTLSVWLPAEPKPWSGGQSPPALLVLLAFAALVVLARTTADPADPNAAEALAGARHLTETCRLPYGQASDTPNAFGPLVYLAALPIELLLADGHAAATFATIVAGSLMVGLVLLGRLLRGWSGGVLLACLVAVAPPMLRQLSDPARSLPVMLVVWALVLSRLRWGGGWSSGLVMALAAGAGLYPVLLVPACMGHLWHRGRELTGFVLGFAAVCVVTFVATLGLTTPARPGSILPPAGLQPTHALAVDSETGTARSVPLPVTSQSEMCVPSIVGWFRWLALDGGAEPTSAGPGDAERLDWLRTRAGDAEGRRLLDAAYAKQVNEYSAGRRWVAAARTALEATGVIELAVAGWPEGGLWWALGEPAEPLTTLDLPGWQQRAKLLVVILSAGLFFVGMLSVRRGDLHRLTAGIGGVCLASQFCATSFQWHWLAFGPFLLAGLFLGRAPAPADSQPPDARQGLEAGCPLLRSAQAGSEKPR